MRKDLQHLHVKLAGPWVFIHPYGSNLTASQTKTGPMIQPQRPEILGLNTLSEGKEDMLVDFLSMKKKMPR